MPKKRKFEWEKVWVVGGGTWLPPKVKLVVPPMFSFRKPHVIGETVGT